MRLNISKLVLHVVLEATTERQVSDGGSSDRYHNSLQCGTKDALCDLVTYLREDRKKKNLTLLVSLDTEGAFDNAWWPAIKNHLPRKRYPRNLYHLVDSYLKDRRVVMNYARATREKETTKGCI
ncbi:hypothetical protein EVAR_50036_1 [Eumeta japonica]|uniref:Uncharacterized protein n=1 Tax=Eumeta variegata TaxID=151549 RepID=A0A4C1XIY7_EUMVA|nr:hypothetical protein EVAR_50036_1 [Eumeta japonica]